MFKKYFILRSYGSKSQKFDSSLSGSSEELSILFHLPLNQIFLNTPFCRKRLRPNEIIPKTILSQLYVKTTFEQDYFVPSYYFFHDPRPDSTDFFVYVSVVSSQGKHFYQFLAPVDVSLGSMEKIFKSISKSFTPFHSNPQFSFETKKTDKKYNILDISVDEFIENIQKLLLTMIVDVSCEIDKEIRSRFLIISELLSSEISFIFLLDEITKKLIPNLTKKKIINKDESNILFNEIPSIRQAHNQFSSTLCSELNLGQPTSLLFLNYINLFRGSIQFLNKHKTNSNLLTRVIANYQEKFKGEGGFINHYSAVFHRYTVYQMFFKSLLQVTFPCHPDYEFVPVALKEIENLLNDVDSGISSNMDEYELFVLQEKYNVPNLVVPGRSVLYQVEIEFLDSSTGNLFLLSDSILLTTKDIFVNLIPTYEIQFSFSSKENSLSFVLDKKNYMFSFKNCSRDLFIIFLDIIQTKHKVHWRNYEPEITPFPISHHASVFRNGFLYTFGGLVSKKPSCDFQKINIFTGEVSSMPCPIDYRFAHSLNIYKNHLVIFGGRDFERYFNDLWIYDNVDWIPLSHKGIPRAYHSACVSGDSLVIFGGRNEDGLLCCVSIFHFLSRLWYTFYDPMIPPIENCFAFPFGDFILFLGGRTQNNEFNTSAGISFNIRKYQFNIINFIEERGIYLNFNDKIIVLNGKLFQVVQLKQIRNQICVVWKETFDVSGQYSSDLKQATAVFDDQNCVLVYGGINAASVTVCDIKKIEIDDNILFHQDNSTISIPNSLEIVSQTYFEIFPVSPKAVVKANPQSPTRAARFSIELFFAPRPRSFIEKSLQLISKSDEEVSETSIPQSETSGVCSASGSSTNLTQNVTVEEPGSNA